MELLYAAQGTFAEGHEYGWFIPGSNGPRIPFQYTPELSRRARATDIWAAMRTLGRSGIDDLISRSCLYAELFAHRLEEAGFKILNEVETNQVLVSLDG